VGLEIHKTTSESSLKTPTHGAIFLFNENPTHPEYRRESHPITIEYPKRELSELGEKSHRHHIVAS
jgi:hypothetical protein